MAEKEKAEKESAEKEKHMAKKLKILSSLLSSMRN